MGVETAIAWARSTFNCWWGCQKVSEACRDCYAEKWALRTGHKVWGPTARRRFFGDAHWNEPRKWERAARLEQEAANVENGHPPAPPWRVFCSSMADVFEELPEGHPDLDAMAAARIRLWHLIAETPHLTWLLLTKRPENIARCFPWMQKALPPPANVWLGTTVEDQKSADQRVPLLLQAPAVVRFLSVEPMLEHVDFAYGKYNRPGLFWKTCPRCAGSMSVPCAGGGKACPACYPPDRGIGAQGFVNAGIDWVICGGESGGKARPFDLKWARDLRDQCREASVAFFMKQLGDNPVLEPGPITWPSTSHHGADVAEFPEDLRLQNFPIPRAAA